MTHRLEELERFEFLILYISIVKSGQIENQWSCQVLSSQLGVALTLKASSTIFFPMFVQVKCKMTWILFSLPPSAPETKALLNLTISPANSKLLVAVLPPAPQVTLMANG